MRAVESCRLRDNTRKSEFARVSTMADEEHTLNEAMLDLFVSDTEASDFEGFEGSDLE